MKRNQEKHTMAVQSHIESLKLRHQELESRLTEMMNMASADRDDISDLKRKKLHLKDRIESLTKQQKLN